jgi:hypothetical protein
MKEPRKSATSKPQSKPEDKLDEELEESFPASDTRRQPPAGPNGRRSIPSPISLRDGANPGWPRSRCLRATDRRSTPSSACKEQSSPSRAPSR